ncbi:MAG: FtsX-like permease family protein, partial [Xanthomonadales bacterium]|nr:FtsX-like permease family protein [Xanthomonadales bacterium]
VRDIADKVTRAVSAVFWFALAAGVLVLLGAIATTQDEREREGAILRTVGARRRQLFVSHAAEFLAIGVTAGLTATLIAWGLTHLLARELFQIPFTPSAGLLLFGPLVGAALVVGFGLLGTLRVRRVPPLVTLRELG